MTLLRYVTHPNVAIDPALSVPRWSLSAEGRRRARRLVDQPWIDAVGHIVSSIETKAIETAGIVAAHLGVDVEVRAGTGENDRSATGFVPPERFEALADRFFAEPDVSVEGWERAADAQTRITAALADLFDHDPGHDTLIVGHGGVGTLWYCCLAQVPIDRRHDQPGQGHYYTIDRTTRRPLHPWRPIDLIGT